MNKPESGDARDDEVMGVGPTRISNPQLRLEAYRAMVWIALVGLAMLTVYIAQSLLVIFGAMVFASMIDGGARLLGKVLPIRRGWCIAVVLLGTVGFFVWLVYFAGSQISQEAAAFPSIVQSQGMRLFKWLQQQGFHVSLSNVESLAGQAISGVGTITRAVGGILGSVTTLFLILIIGVYVALEPRLYERGVAWMLPVERRADFWITANRMGYTMRRLMFGRLVGMVFEGFFTWIALAIYGVPMAALLGILVGLLAFIPNIGAVISGILMVLVGFSGGTDMGFYTMIVYVVVQSVDGYLVVPMIARKTVDLAPAIVLAAQLIMGILFGVLGLFLADPLMAMIKVVLERRSEQNTARDAEEQSLVSGSA